MLACPAGSWWACALLGAALIAVGVIILFNAVVASLVSAIFFGAAITVGGVFQIIHAFSAKGWGSLVLSLIVGILFTIGGVLLMLNPLAASLGLTLGIAAMLLASGIVRVMMAFRHWGDFGWVLLASGLIGIVTGVVLFLGFPWSGLVVPGILLGLDAVFHGIWWLTLGVLVRRPIAGAPRATRTAAAT